MRSWMYSGSVDVIWFARFTWCWQIVTPVMFAPVNSTTLLMGPPMPMPKSATFMSRWMPAVSTKFCSQYAIDRLKDQSGRSGAMWKASPQPYSKKSVINVKYLSAAAALLCSSCAGCWAVSQSVAPE